MRLTEAKVILSTQNGMNPYRGPGGDPAFVDARFSKARRKGDPEEPEAKGNAPELLEIALRRKKNKCMIMAGGICDPYLPEEAELRLMRRCLEVIDRYGYGVCLQTNEPLLLRDLDLLTSIHRKSRCIVETELCTVSDELSAKLEPGLCPPAERIRMLEELNRAGIPVVVRLTPVLPWVNDSPENLKELLSHCTRNGVYGIRSMGFTFMIRSGGRNAFRERLSACFPDLPDRYETAFGQASELKPETWEELNRILEETCRDYHMECDAAKLFTWMHAFVDREAGAQLSLFDL